MREEVRSHRQLADLARSQHGVVARRQLLELGYSKSAIGRLVKTGLLQPVHRGVYAVPIGGLSPYGCCLAAVLACGPDAVVSHSSAAWAWGLFPTCPKPIDVTAPNRGHPRVGIRLHHAPAMTEDDRAVRSRIPVTALSRTFLDLAETASSARLQHAIERAEQLRMFDLRAVDSSLCRAHGHRGVGRLRRALTAYREPAFTRSELERRFLRRVRTAGLPIPATNHFVGGYEIDVYWEEARFGVELDTYEFHGGRVAFERDRVRQEDLKLGGVEIVRVTGRRFDREPDLVIERIAALLSRRRRETEGGGGRQ